MAYQPIQLPGYAGGGLGDVFREARDSQRQAEQDRWKMLQGDQEAQRLASATQQTIQHQQFEDQRQQQADRDAVMKELQRLHDAGLGHQAETFAQMHGYTFKPQANTMQAPTAPQMPAEPQAPPENPLQGPVLPGATDPGSQQIQGERDAVAAFPAQQEEYGRQMTEVFPGQQAEYEKAQAAFDQRAANPIVEYSGPGGAFTIDPLEARRAELAKNAERADLFRQTFANEPALAAHAGDMAARVGVGEAPRDVFTDLRTQISAEATARAAAEKEAQRQAEDAKYKPDVATQDRWHREANRAAMARGAAANPQNQPTDPRLAELLQMKIDGKNDSEIAARAAELHVPESIWTGPVKNIPREEAVKDKTAERHRQLEVTGLNGEPLGEAHSPNDKKKLDDANIAFQQMHDRAQALIDDIHANGDRVLAPADVQRRNALYAAFAAAGRVYNALGVSNANVELEKQIAAAAGTPGHGWLMGANADVLQHALNEANSRHEAQLKVRLRKAPASSAQGGNPPDMRAKAEKALNDPNAPEEAKAAARKILGR
jgi:hypothetical protein